FRPGEGARPAGDHLLRLGTHVGFSRTDLNIPRGAADAMRERRWNSRARLSNLQGDCAKYLGGGMARQKRPILVVGGGIGGLSTAPALGRRRWRVRVLEQTPELGAIGYGIQLGPNVFPMFDRLGLRDAVLAKSILPGACVLFDALTGEPLTRVA